MSKRKATVPVFVQAKRQLLIVRPMWARYQVGGFHSGKCAVPVALVVLLLDITLIWHASRTGRLQPWAFIILMVPLIGALAYIVVELLPEWFSSPDAQRARQRMANKLDPEKR
jgi:hypothetical protein